MIPQIEINEEFKKIAMYETREWRDAVTRSFIYSGYKILDKIGQDEKILDIGCGRNLFKPHRANLLGIDPVNDDADIKIAFQDFETTEKFDTILCLGSLHFGELEDIALLIKKLTGMITPGGKVFWRCATVSDAWFQFAWTKQLHYDFAKEFGYSVIELEDDYMVDRDTNTTREHKIYAQWIKDL